MLPIAELERLLLTLVLMSPRMLTVFSVLPFMGPSILPVMLRNSIVLSLTVVLFPMVQAQFPAEIPNTFQILGILVKEVFVGLLIGYLVAIIFWVVGAIGNFIDTQRGATMASALVPLFGDQTSPLGNFLNQTVTTLFFISGGALVLLKGLYQSYQTWPVFSFYPRLDLQAALFFIEQLDLLMYLTFVLAGPVVLTMFLTELGMGLIGRFVPQLNVFFLALPIKSGIAVFVLVLYMSTLIYFFRDEFMQFSSLFIHLENLLL